MVSEPWRASTSPAVTTSCPGCAQSVDAAAKFCPHCGTAQPERRTETAVPTGERRRLTILFCDLAGSTALSELLDPETLGELVLGGRDAGI